MYSLLSALLVASVSVPTQTKSAELDSDGDGLSDFHEIHKFGTDPKRADSDGDGVDDGDWLERREFAYTVRSVVQVMKPVTLEYLNDDFQDVRLLNDGGEYVELEVVHYPFGTANEALASNENWKRPDKELERWLAPGLTSDWTPAMRKALLAALKDAGIDVDRLTDKEVVEQVSRWLLQHASYEVGFTAFLTSFDKQGRAYVPDPLRERAEREVAASGRTLEQQWAREISARGMFEHGTRGSCSSSAIYYSGCLRALGIPTRTVLCIPLIDANDERERQLVETRLEHNLVRKIVAESAQSAIGSWTSHTFNEVWVGDRWRRLNYDKLGQDILDSNYLGLMTHVATFHDWADARMPETIGCRAESRAAIELFGGLNPYSTISLSDNFGVHCKLENPDLENPRGDEKLMTVSALAWTDDESLPVKIYANCEERGRFGLIARVDEIESGSSLRAFLASADLRVHLRCEKQSSICVKFDAGCWWINKSSAYIYLPLHPADRRELISGAEYFAVARNHRAGFAWKFTSGIRR